MEGKKVKCDNCKELILIDLKERVESEKITVYFECPICKEEYHVVNTNKKARVKIEKLKHRTNELRDIINAKIKKQKKATDEMEEYKKIMKEIKQEMINLN